MRVRSIAVGLDSDPRVQLPAGACRYSQSQRSSEPKLVHDVIDLPIPRRRLRGKSCPARLVTCEPYVKRPKVISTSKHAASKLAGKGVKLDETLLQPLRGKTTISGEDEDLSSIGASVTTAGVGILALVVHLSATRSQSKRLKKSQNKANIFCFSPCKHPRSK